MSPTPTNAGPVPRTKTSLVCRQKPLTQGQAFPLRELGLGVSFRAVPVPKYSVVTG